MGQRAETGPRSLPGSSLLFACFFASGALGLMYEVVWLRTLGLVFGHTVYAITTVLAAFMAGLALGSLLLGRWAPRIRNLVGAYGWLEIGIGVSCALVPLLLGAASAVYLALHRALDLSYDAFSLVQFLLVFALLLVPTALMGGTLPILSQALVRREVDLGRRVSALYAVNTAGAVAGVALAGYVLLPALGNRATTTIAAIANVLVGVLAIAWSRRRVPRPEALQAPAEGPAAAPAPEAPPLAGPPPSGGWLVVAALGVSGAVSMLYEVAWTRALALVIGSSTYAFTAMLVAFLAGIGGGSALYAWLWGRRPSSPALFAALQAAIGLSGTAVLLAFPRMPEAFLLALRWSDSPAFVQGVQLAISAGALLLPALLIGATFPCAVAAAARGLARVGRDVGQVYAVNTLGAIAGTVAAGFVLVPAIGVHASLRLGIVVNLLLAALLLAVPPRRRGAWPWGSLAATLAGAGVVFLPPWDAGLMSSGPAVYAKGYLAKAGSGGLADIVRRQGEVLFYRDGLSGTVSVLRTQGHVYLRVNGKTDASNGGDMPTQLMSGHLPLLVHPDPRAVLVIGLGSGITAGAVARHPVERLDVVEIEPAVVEAARFFAWEHGDVLKDPRVRTVIADGRNFLLGTSARYDVIISEPSNPWIGGLASLFSVEFFRLAREHLAPGGIMLQWIQGYNLLPDDLRMVVGTFRSVFPATSIWSTTPGDFLLLGRTEPTPLDVSLVESRFPRIRSDMLGLGIQAWPGVLGYFALRETDAGRLAAGAGLNTDDRLPLEFSAPRALYLDTTLANQRLMEQFRTAALPDLTPAGREALERPDARYWIGAAYLGRGAVSEALSHFRSALERDPEHGRALLAAGRASLALHRSSEALGLARRLIHREPLNAQAFFLAGLAARELDGTREAAAFFQRAAALEPGNAEFQRALERAASDAASRREPRRGRERMPWLVPPAGRQ